MEWIQVIVLAVIQGLTEFLPVSSSAHLILPSQLLGWQDQGLAFDVGVHVGTIVAVVAYFRHDVLNMLIAFFQSLTGKRSDDGRLAWLIIAATIPALAFGLLLNDMIDLYGRSILVIAGTTLIFGALLWIADRRENAQKPITDLTLKSGLAIGFAQALALIPGTSRSGITMTIGLMLGLSRDNAARFSFLLSIPAIAMAGSYLTLKLILSTEAVDWQAIGLGSLLAFISAYACIHYFLILLNKLGMMPFVIYRLILGFGLLWFVLT